MTKNYQIGFIIEQALGHITHGKNLEKNGQLDPEITPHWILPEQPKSGLAALPGIRNWTLQAGMQANRGIQKLVAAGNRPDVLFFHTQITAILAKKWMTQIPSVISLDATPIQYDALGEFYDHRAGGSWLESFKFKLNQDCYKRAKHIITWSDWARQSLISDYGISDKKMTVLSPGVNISEWETGADRQSRDGQPVRILFVGGDLKRKGGLDLLQAFKAAKSELPSIPLELHIVTHDSLPAADDVYVHRNLEPNSGRLKGLYQQADIFCLPTYADCLPLVLAEAAAASLPIISTNVTAIPDIVRPTESGILVDPGDVQALKEAIVALAKNPAERRRMGQIAYQQTVQNNNAQTNARRLFELLKTVSQK